jgi:RNase H
MEYSNPIRVRIPDRSSVFTAELRAIRQAIEHISDPEQKQLIITDSLSVLTALGNRNNRSTEIENLSRKIRARRHNTTLLWVPGHNGIDGNEKADLEAKSALELHTTYSQTQQCRTCTLHTSPIYQACNSENTCPKTSLGPTKWLCPDGGWVTLAGHTDI